MKKEIIKTQELNFKNLAIIAIVFFFVGFGLYHFIKEIIEHI